MRRNTALVLVAVVVVAGAVAASVVSAGVPGGHAAKAAATNGTTIAVSASESASASPDLAVVSVSVVASADSANTARERAAANASDLRDALSAAGVASDDVRTTSYRVSERTEKSPDGARTYYEAVHDFEVTVRDPSAAGDVIDAALAGGANRVRGVRFTLSDETRAALRSQAIDAAMSDARSQADAAADAAGLSVTGVSHVSIGGAHHPVTYASGSAAGADTKTTIGQRDVTVTVTVQATYEAD